ncbi:MAG TPA: AAA family ATPase [Spirochaetia bacterium]|nr:AAA family ATPase [Spirochaetia bacterium]
MNSRSIADLSDADLSAEKSKLNAQTSSTAETSARFKTELLRAKRPKIWSGPELVETEFPEPRWIVPGLVPEGLSILAGVPKLGKSWLMLSLALAASSGGVFLGNIWLSPIGVLLLSLEDTPRRLKNRMQKMNAEVDGRLHIATSWPKGRECVEQLDAYLSENPEIKFIGIDTLAKVIAIDDGKDYIQTYEAVGQLKTVADKHGAAITTVHHVGKAVREDWVQGLMDSTGYGAAADTILALTRKRGQADAVLKATGRDVEEQEIALRFDADIGTWASLGNAADVQETRERQELVDYLQANGRMKSGELAKALQKSPQATSNLLVKLEHEGVVHSPEYGRWEAINPRVTRVSSESAEEELTHDSPLTPVIEDETDDEGLF